MLTNSYSATLKAITNVTTVTLPHVVNFNPMTQTHNLRIHTRKNEDNTHKINKQMAKPDSHVIPEIVFSLTISISYPSLPLYRSLLSFLSSRFQSVSLFLSPSLPPLIERIRVQCSRSLSLLCSTAFVCASLSC